MKIDQNRIGGVEAKWPHNVGGIHQTKERRWSKAQEQALWDWLECSGYERLFSINSPERISVYVGSSSGSINALGRAKYHPNGQRIATRPDGR